MKKSILLLIITVNLFTMAVPSFSEEIKLIYHDLTLNANLVMTDGKDFTAPIAVIVHGTLTHKGRSTYAQLQQNLADKGFHSLAINLSLGLNNRQDEYNCASGSTGYSLREQTIFP